MDGALWLVDFHDGGRGARTLMRRIRHSVTLAMTPCGNEAYGFA